MLDNKSTTQTGNLNTQTSSHSIYAKCQSVHTKCQGVHTKCQGVHAKSQGVHTKCQGVHTKCRSTQEKYQDLCKTLESMGSVIVAFSGGVDSTFLLQTAADVLGERCLAVTAVSEVYTERECQEAIELAKAIKVKHQVIKSTEMTKEEFIANPPERCYHCKMIRFTELLKLAQKLGYNYVIDGANADDVHDYRPGQQAARELGIRSPLEEAGLTKSEIRALSRERGLATWNKPSAACLASRLPYGARITVEKLRQINQAEDLLKQLGFSALRVRHHGDIARIEVPVSDFPMLTAEGMLANVVQGLKSLGFSYVTLDLAGLRSGSMNEVLNNQ